MRYIQPILLLYLFLFLMQSIQSAHAGLLDRFTNRHSTDFVEDISYGPDKRQKLDIYLPQEKEAEALLPVHIFIHGGAWQIGNKSRYREHGVFYTRNNIIFVPINYRLSPQYRHPAQAEDCAAAIKWVYDHIREYGGDPNRIFLSGHSAGAHLAALLGTDAGYLEKYDLSPSLLKTIIPVDTASFDFTHPIEKRIKIVQKAIEQTFGTDSKALAEASPLTHIQNNKNLPPFLLFVTGNRPEAVTQTRSFHIALQENGGQSDIYIIPRITHRAMAQAMADDTSPIAQKILDRMNY